MARSPKKQSSNSKGNGKAITTAVAVLVTALNAIVGYWGFSNAKDIASLVKEAEAKLERISSLAKEAETKFRAISQVTEDVYYFQAKSLEREVMDLLKDLPGIELTGPKSEKVKSEIRRSHKSMETLELTLPVEKRSKAKFLAEGFLCFIKKDYEGAVDKLKEYDQETPEKYLLLGQAYRKLKKLDRAEDVLNKVGELTKTNRANTILAKSLNTRANLASDKGNYDEALLFYKQALQYDPNLYGIHYNCAAVNCLKGRYEDALISLCSFAKYHDGDVIAQVELDSDHDFDSLKKFLGDNWKNKLRQRLSYCND
jgi:tetratricopeptide (TPR) repeat protein